MLALKAKSVHKVKLVLKEKLALKVI